MANPRKFSEKIALHNQKQAEETAAFEQIMREVSDATSKSALSNLEEMRAGRSDSIMVRESRVRHVGVGPMRSRPNEKRIDTSPYSGVYLSPPPDTNWRRTNSDSALHQSAMNMGSETSLHSPGSQRRVTDGQLLGIGLSDSLDPSRKQLGSSSDGRPRSCCDVPRVPGINIYPSQQDPGTVQIPIGNNTGSLPDLTSFHFPPPLNTPLDQEDPSSSPYSTSPQAVSPSTLSPTSLSSRQMGKFSFGGSPQDSQGPSPGHSPISRRRPYHPLQNLVIGGPQSPTQLSQTNHLSVPLVNTRYLHTCKGVTLDNSGIDNFQQNQFVYQQTQQQTHQPQQQQQSPNQQLQQQQHSSQPQHSPQPQSPQQVQSRQPSPQPVHHTPPAPSSPQQSQQPPQQQQQTQPQCSPSLISNSPNTSTQHLNSLSTYRSPQPLSRPSPQTSPGLIMQGSLVYRSGSPGETSHSGPQSPVSPASSPGIGPNTSPFPDHNSYYISQAQANALQQHFEQFSMMDNPVSTSLGYMGTQNNTTNYSQVSEERLYGLEYTTTPYTLAVSHGSPEDGLTQVGTQELSTDAGFYSQSPTQLQYNRPVINPSGGSTQQTTPQTPNTPSSIPDIILTDFSSSTGDDLSRQEFVKDLGSAMSGSFDPDLLPSDEMLREGLEPIDFDGLQMLTDPEITVITDSATEDNFRLDKL